MAANVLLPEAERAVDHGLLRDRAQYHVSMIMPVGRPVMYATNAAMITRIYLTMQHRNWTQSS